MAQISFERRKTWWSTPVASSVQRTEVGTRLPKRPRGARWSSVNPLPQSTCHLQNGC